MVFLLLPCPALSPKKGLGVRAEGWPTLKKIKNKKNKKKPINNIIPTIPATDVEL
jgi:hypothetical protein